MGQVDNMKGKERMKEREYILIVELPVGLLSAYGYRIAMMKAIGDMVVNLCRDVDNIVYDYPAVLFDYETDKVLYEGTLYNLFNCMYDVISV